MDFNIGDSVRFKKESFSYFKKVYPITLINWKLKSIGIIDEIQNGSTRKLYCIKFENRKRLWVNGNHIQNAKGQIPLPFKFREG